MGRLRAPRQNKTSAVGNSISRMVSPFQSRCCGRQKNYGFRLTVQKLPTVKIYQKQSIKCSKDSGWGVMKIVRLTPEIVTAKEEQAPT